MKRRILAAILGVATVAVLLFAVPLALVAVHIVNEDAVLHLERQAFLAARAIPAAFASGVDPVELPDPGGGVVLSLYDRDGTLVAGVGPMPADDVTMQAFGNEVVDAEVGEARVVAVPIAVDEVVVGAIRAQQSTATVDAKALRIVSLLGGLSAAVLGVGAFIGWVLSGRLARPIQQLRDSAVQLGDGDFTVVVPKSGISEIDDTADALESTAGRLDELVTRERQFSGDVSHQLRTPLAGLRASIETELTYPRSDPTEVLNEAIVDLDRVEQTVADLLAVARGTRSSSSQMSLDEVLGGLSVRWKRAFTDAGRALEITSGRFAPAVRGSAAALGHALDVLMDNALHHGAGVTRLSISTADNSLTLRLTDEGPGFPPALDPLEASQAGISSDRSGRIGLPLAARLVDAMPGRIVIVRPGPNPEIDIVLQRVDSPSRPVTSS